MHFSTRQLADAIEALEHESLDVLAGFVACPSFSGSEQTAIEYLEPKLQGLGLATERIPLDSAQLRTAPLYSPSCDPDGGRYNLLAEHHPRQASGKSLLFNGHVDIVPTGPEHLWSRPPLQAAVKDGRMYGRGAGDMKSGIVCAMAAFEALRRLGAQPAAKVGFNAVLEEENTGNGTLASVMRTMPYEAVVIPEPFDESLMSAQVGVLWLSIELTGSPAHVAYMASGVNPIEAAIAVHAGLKKLEAEWNRPEHRHAAYRGHEHPINFNLGRIEGGEWNSSVPCVCRMGVRVGFFPGVTVESVKQAVEQAVHATLATLPSRLGVRFDYKGFQAPGCEFDLEHPAMRALAGAHEKVNGTQPRRLAMTATTDARHFQLISGLPVTCYGPQSGNIHGVDEWVSIVSMRRVSTVMAQFMQDWCGLEPI
ncbi:MAG: ArgE/DapE family deacylase [Proteobacteria bacterium]|nr:ArgE/DapE family deacylase [Pseudomonadota bacterium]